MTGMKLSTAIRLGAMLRPQATGGRAMVRARGWRGWLLRERVMGTCALQAAAEAIGLMDWTDLIQVYPLLYILPVRCPATGEVNCLSEIVWKLNDLRGWTRGQIADQVEMWEKDFEAQQPSLPLAAQVAVEA